MAANKGNSKERQEKILKFIAEAGAWRISSAVVKELAKEFDVSERQIYLDFKRVVKKIPVPVMDIVAKKFILSFDKAINKSIRMMDSTSEETQIKAIKLYFDAVASYTHFLESYRFKEKVPEKYEVKGPTKLKLEIIHGRIESEEQSSDGSSSKK